MIDFPGVVTASWEVYFSHIASLALPESTEIKLFSETKPKISPKWDTNSLASVRDSARD